LVNVDDVIKDTDKAEDADLAGDVDLAAIRQLVLAARPSWCDSSPPGL